MENKQKEGWGNTNIDNTVLTGFYDSLDQDDFPVIVRNAWNVLKIHPGSEFSVNVVEEVNRKIVKHLLNNSWTSIIEPLLDLYPVRSLSDLAFKLWQNGRPEFAAVLYQKILKKFPLEVKICHKSLYFLGRIFEDKEDYESSLKFYRILIEKIWVWAIYPGSFI